MKRGRDPQEQGRTGCCKVKRRHRAGPAELPLAEATCEKGPKDERQEAVGMSGQALWAEGQQAPCPGAGGAWSGGAPLGRTRTRAGGGARPQCGQGGDGEPAAWGILGQ